MLAVTSRRERGACSSSTRVERTPVEVQADLIARGSLHALEQGIPIVAAYFSAKLLRGG